MDSTTDAELAESVEALKVATVKRILSRRGKPTNEAAIQSEIRTHGIRQALVNLAQPPSETGYGELAKRPYRPPIHGDEDDPVTTSGTPPDTAPREPAGTWFSLWADRARRLLGF